MQHRYAAAQAHVIQLQRNVRREIQRIDRCVTSVYKFPHVIMRHRRILNDDIRIRVDGLEPVAYRLR